MRELPGRKGRCLQRRRRPWRRCQHNTRSAKKMHLNGTNPSETKAILNPQSSASYWRRDRPHQSAWSVCPSLPTYRFDLPFIAIVTISSSLLHFKHIHITSRGTFWCEVTVPPKLQSDCAVNISGAHRPGHKTEQKLLQVVNNARSSTWGCPNASSRAFSPGTRQTLLYSDAKQRGSKSFQGLRDPRGYPAKNPPWPHEAQIRIEFSTWASWFCDPPAWVLWTDPKRLELQELAPQLNFLCSKRERSPRSAGAGTEPHVPSHPLNPGATEAELPTGPILPTLPPKLQLATWSECYVFPKGHSWIRDWKYSR